MKKNIFLSLLFLLFVAGIYSQTIDQPNYGLKTHPTLDIESVVLTGSSTTLYMVIENKSLDGTFCADKNIYIILPSGKHLKIKATEGIPRCPETYAFKNYGEKMLFNLTFPALPAGTEWFDLVEDCNDACFTFNSVILNSDLNRKIDHAYATLESKDTEKAIIEFENLISDFKDNRCSFQGSLYWNLIELARQSNDTERENEWLDKLHKSDIPLKEKFIEILQNN